MREYVDMLDGIGVRGEAVHAIDRGRHGRAQISAVIVPMGEPQRAHHPSIVVGCCNARNAVWSCARGGEMLQPVLDPFDRAPRNPRSDAQHHDVWKQGELGAEAAAGVRRTAVAQPAAWNAQRTRHHGVKRKRSLKIGNDIIAAAIGQMLGYNCISFHGRDGIARVADGDLGVPLRPREDIRGVAVAKLAVGDDIAAYGRMQDGCVCCCRSDRIDDRR